ncbi:PAS domain-containing protein [Rhodopirellula sp. JC740]|uniref:histidine kinase n=1 Tax=Rhodopirellula halodulae TaxID=2894198 RepID=A0ABS8NJB2_9BACT|nr:MULTISPECIES: chemotaxis protein CheB [unclassified Rhodopirellula]MCC9642883.1 PAS domain-containing protein [Rhodopirellula sp. JC740]MCC9656258.1 PAS domain-containing protein [Rhodopirellula sp. JC737]
MSDSEDQPLLVIGIGASAGGLAPIEDFFDHMPADSGMAFVIIQHLSPDFKSLMDELLARHTKMTIRKVTDGMTVEPDTIYLIPPEKNMALSAGKLLLTQQDHARGLNLPIDIFFRSLAQDAGPRAVAIVLSGTGSDGSRGIKDVRELGGVVMVQTEASAGFDGMPRAAIQSNAVDVVCTPEEMPSRLIEYAKGRDRDVLKNQDEISEGTGDSALFSILRMFRLRHGLDFALYKPATITRRLERRMQMGGFKDANEYAALLENDEEEVEALYRDLLVEVTQFFRDEAAFVRLRNEIIPKIVENAAVGDELRIWVPGCATGEEAYSIAMLFHEAMEKEGRTCDYKVFATDVHRTSLETASTGVYPTSALDTVPTDFQVKYFTQSGGLCHIKRDVRQRVIFAANDLTNDPPFTRLDFISCRNVLIYLEPKIQKRILSLFHFGLRTGGILFLGPSETVGDLAPEFETLDRHWRLYSKRRDVRLPDAARLPMTPILSTVIREKQHGFVAVAPQGDRQAWVSTAMEDLLTKHVPPSLMVNEFNEVIHTFGDARKLLVQPEGRPSLDVLKMLCLELRTATSAALHRAKQKGVPAIFDGIRVAGDESTPDRIYKITVEPYKKSSQSLYLICIEEMHDEVSDDEEAERFRSDDLSSERISNLELELSYTRETLQATVEELESSNEELQATNQELIASNEELQSTNEELHSVNEELYTVNSEHKQKIEELTQLTSDMDNLLKSTDIGTIFLDNELCIRMFTPAISAAFNVMEQDIGRPINHIAYKLDSPNLLSDAAAVLASAESREIEVQNSDGRVYLQRMQPYRTEEGVVRGIVLTTTDITALKQAEQAQRTLMTLAQVGEELPDFAYAVSHDLQAPLRHISQYAEMLDAATKENDSQKILKSGKVIRDSASNLSMMIEALLTYSRINTLGRPLDRVPLTDAIGDALANLSTTLDFYGAEVEMDELAVVAGDREQLQLLFFHLIDNAIKYRSDQPPRIHLSNTAVDGFVQINVADNGIGVDERHANRVFTIFKRLGFKPDVPGIGVGLAICKRIVIRHGGRIWLERSPSGGTVVCLTLREYKPFSSGNLSEQGSGDHA